MWAFSSHSLRRHHTQMVRGSSSSYKIDYVILIKNFLNPKGRKIPSADQKLHPFYWSGVFGHPKKNHVPSDSYGKNRKKTNSMNSVEFEKKKIFR